MVGEREYARSAVELRHAGPETWVPIEFDTAEFLRRCDGRLVCKVYEDFDGVKTKLWARRWARDAARYHKQRRGALKRLIQRASRDRNVLDALLAALEAGGDFVVQLAVSQAKRE